MFPRASRGFAAPLAVFIIVLGAALAGGLAMLSGTQQGGIALDMQGVRAYQTARAGLEWSVHHVLRTAGLDCAGIQNPDTLNQGTTFSAGGGLADFSVTVRCTESSHTEGSATIVMYELTANACNLPRTDVAPIRCPNPNPGSPTYAERELRVTVGSE
jgi:MSHA biogenesis protein MshP